MLNQTLIPSGMKNTYHSYKDGTSTDEVVQIWPNEPLAGCNSNTPIIWDHMSNDYVVLQLTSKLEEKKVEHDSCTTLG